MTKWRLDRSVAHRSRPKCRAGPWRAVQPRTYPNGARK